MSGVEWVRLGEIVQPVEERNTGLLYGPEDVMGISVDKKLIPTKADMTGVNLKSYIISHIEDIAYVLVTSRNGGKISVAINDYGDCIISSINIVFRIVDRNRVDPHYLMLYFRRPEFDRYARFHSWGSARETFTWESMSQVLIPLPPLSEQSRLSAVVDGLERGAQRCQSLAVRAEQAAQSLAARAARTHRKVRLGELVQTVEERNTNNAKYAHLGVNKDKMFMPTKAASENIDSSRYLIVRKNQFVFSGMQTGRDNSIRFALYAEDEPALVSPAYNVLAVKDNVEVLPTFIHCCFLSPEKDRLGSFLSDASVRANLDLPRFLDIQIPLPPLWVQSEIAALYESAEHARRDAARARVLSSGLCPALIAQIERKDK